MTSKLLAALLLCGLWTSVPYADDKAPTAQQLLDAAHFRTELTSLAPYTLSATVVINPGTKNQQTGHLTIYRDRERSRVDLETGDYNETRVTVGERSYIPRGKHLLMFTGLADFDQSWDPGRPPRYSTEPAHKFGKVKEATINSRSAWCFDKGGQYGTDRLCFDAASSLLIRQNSSQNDRDEYLDYSTGQHSFPRLVRIKKRWLAPLEIRDISISPGALDDHLFDVPPEAIELGACKKDTRPPEAVSTPEPDFPASAPRVNTQATVVLSAIVNKEGRVEEIVVLNPDGFGFGANAKAAVSQWRFKPGTCSGQPINTEMVLEVDLRRF